MARIQHIPANRVGEIVQAFVDEGKKRIEAEAEDENDPTGTWTISGHD